jgi:hypothetical protein
LKYEILVSEGPKSRSAAQTHKVDTECGQESGEKNTIGSTDELQYLVSYRGRVLEAYLLLQNCQVSDVQIEHGLSVRKIAHRERLDSEPDSTEHKIIA